MGNHSVGDEHKEDMERRDWKEDMMQKMDSSYSETVAMLLCNICKHYSPPGMCGKTQKPIPSEILNYKIRKCDQFALNNSVLTPVLKDIFVSLYDDGPEEVYKK